MNTHLQSYQAYCQPAAKPGNGLIMSVDMDNREKAENRFIENYMEGYGG
jgi:hypothetical protein